MIGPLLYHFADMPAEMSIELSWTDLRETILKFGFQILVRSCYPQKEYKKKKKKKKNYWAISPNK